MNIINTYGKKIILSLCAVTILAFATFHASQPLKKARQTWRSQEECEKATSLSCGFLQCDYVPKGKTFEEVCGEEFQKGWVPNAEKKE